MPDPLVRIDRRRKEAIDPLKPPGSTPPGDIDASGEVEQDGFRDILESIAGVPAQKRLDGLLGEIRDLAAVLARRRLIEDLEEYRYKVGEFLRVYLDEVLAVKDAGGRRGLRRRRMVVVKRIDVELEELGRMVLGGAKDFKIIKELGTIEGLLMDLYR